MLVKVSIGMGSFGKLWTGTELRRAHEDPKNKLWDFKAKEAIPNIVDAFIMERTCDCGASTRKFRATAVQQSDEARAALDLPECFITGGGVGSIYVETDKVAPETLVHNWSGRTGGHVILNPLMILSGYVSRDDLPAAKPGYGWVCTYSGSTLSEYVLLPVTVDAPTGPLGWGLPTVKLSGECPPCREKREAAESPAPPQSNEPVEIANDGTYSLRRVQTQDGIRYEAGCRNFNLTEALVHWREDGDSRATLFHAALLKEQASSESGLSVEVAPRVRRERGERGERRERRPRGEQNAA